MKITFMGAGSTVFARNVIGDCMCVEALRDSVFALYDIDRDENTQEITADDIHQIAQIYGDLSDPNQEYVYTYVGGGGTGSFQLGDAADVFLHDLIGGGNCRELAHDIFVLSQEIVLRNIRADQLLRMLDRVKLLLVIQGELALFGETLTLFHRVVCELLQFVSKRHVRFSFS